MEGLPNLPPHQQQMVHKKLERLQVKDSVNLFISLSDRCFNQCVTSFRSKTLDKYEDTCLENCAKRYLKMTQRAGMRFQEHQAMLQKKGMDAATLGGK
mmetsp:Transcript_4099/g.5578  ORF Transcript_4099/g.5578 Transcript_4099/m.5578 type:complete len:98 (+) Transcript_4099:117-410(+)